MSEDEDLALARAAAFGEVARRAAEARTAARAAIDERDLVEHEVDTGEYDAGSDEHLERLDVVLVLEDAAAAARTDVDDALDRLRELEIRAWSGRSAAELTAIAEEAQQARRAPATSDDDRLGWAVAEEAATLLLAGLRPAPAVEGADPGEGAAADDGDASGEVTSAPAVDLPAATVPLVTSTTAVSDVDVGADPVGVPTVSARRLRRLVPPKPTGAEVVTALVVVAVVVAGLAAVGRTPKRAPLRQLAASVPVTAPPSTNPVATTSAPTTAVPTTLPPTTVPVADITAQAEACPALRSGSVGNFTPNNASTGVDTDPRRNVPTPYVGVGFAASSGDTVEQRPAYSVVALLYQPGVAAATTGGAVDRQGSTQLWFTWDGTSVRHKGVRRLVSGSWVMTLDPDDLTVAFGPTSTVFFWPGIQPGWSYAMYVATANGCTSVSTQPDGSPAPVKAS